jgi:light-regulated signal transduction histidine kinase (bacteriophytochrome)
MKMEKNLILDIANDENPFKAFLTKNEAESFESKSIIPNKGNFSFLFPLFIELIQRTKGTLESIKNLTQVSQGKFNDKEFGNYFNRLVTEDVKKIDLLLSNVLDYIKVNCTVRKTNTVHIIIEEGLKKHQVQLEEKKVRLFKKFEKDLPEIIVPDEELRYILNSILQYAIILMPVNGNIWFLTRSFVLPSETSEDQALFKKDGKHIEISLIFTGYKKPKEQFTTVRQISGPQREEGLDLELRLVNEIVKRNRGKMKFGGDEKNSKTFISLRFPAERRKVIYYQPVN